MKITMLLNKLKVISILTFVLFSLFSCDDSSTEDIDRDIESLLTINQGVYGQATKHNDVGDNPVEYNEGFVFELFSEIPSSDPNDGVVPIASTEAGGQGFYEIEMVTGQYCLCTTFRQCLSINVIENDLLRLDYQFGLLAGWSFNLDEENINLGCT